MLSISPKDESFISHFITVKKRDRVRRVRDRYRERERGREREEGGKERERAREYEKCFDGKKQEKNGHKLWHCCCC